METITLSEFNKLSDKTKKQLLVDALKISENRKGNKRYEIFLINDFYIEVVTDFNKRAERQIKTYSYKNVPHNYRSNITHYRTKNLFKVPSTFLGEYLH